MAIWGALIKPVAGLFMKGLDIVDDMVPDKDLAVKLKAALKERILEIANTEFLALLKAQSSIILAEAQGDSWLQRNWRPATMITFVFIIANNYILAPYIGLFAGPDYKIILEIPPDMWQLLKIGLGGYVVGRTTEKIAAGEGVKSIAGKILNGITKK